MVRKRAWYQKVKGYFVRVDEGARWCCTTRCLTARINARMEERGGPKEGGGLPQRRLRALAGIDNIG